MQALHAGAGLMEALAALPIPPDVGGLIVASGLIVLRLSVMSFLIPVIGETAVPVRVRMAMVLAVSAALIPALMPLPIPPLVAVDIARLALYEGLIGFALGFSFRVLIFALMAAGTIIAQSISLSQLFGSGAASEPNPSVALLLMSAGAALFVTLDFHVQAIGLLYESYELFPLGDVPSTEHLASWATERTVGAFRLAVSLALPFVLINFVYNVILGIINQAMPQMMVTFIGVPVNVLAGFVVLLLAVSAILIAWIQAVGPAFDGFW